MKNITCYGNPTQIKRVCQWTGKEFWVDWKHRNQNFINKNAMYEWRKSLHREVAICLTCKHPFERYKNILHPKTKLPTQHCSEQCARSSPVSNQKKREWGLSNKNHWRNPLCQKKVKETKLKLYGDANYNNMPKNTQTCMTKYGVPYTCYLPKCKSNGRRVSKFQKRVFVEIKKIHPDTELEKYLPDVQKFVDIYIPSIKKVIECHGDYWHCNPTKCSPDYYNHAVHLTAKQIWNRDREKENLLKSKGYNVEIIWENTKKKFKHTIET